MDQKAIDRLLKAVDNIIQQDEFDRTLSGLLVRKSSAIQELENAREPFKGKIAEQPEEEKYGVIHGQCLVEMVDDVNKAIENGWTLQGEMHITVLDGEPLFYQTMVRN